MELLIQERAYFKDRKRPTYFEHREINIQRWKQLYRDLMAAGRIREMPVERITNVLSNVLYGIMVTNFFNGQTAPADVQAREILDIVFLGILSEPERQPSHERDDGRHCGRRSAETSDTLQRSGKEIFGGANGHEATIGGWSWRCRCWRRWRRVSAGAIGAGAADPDRRL